MYTAESLSSIFTYLLDLFGTCPKNEHLKGIVYDRACELHPFEELHPMKVINQPIIIKD